jgi:exopolysaccharide biosynthesis predicted pyruvyltransferase EpsI
MPGRRLGEHCDLPDAINLAAVSAVGDPYARLRAQALDVLCRLLVPGTRCALVDFPHHANVGDSAIWLGERALLRRAGVEVAYTCDVTSFRSQDLLDQVPAGTILIHGGGNFGDLWPHHQDFRERIIETFPYHRIVQLPQSIHFDDRANLDRARSVLGAHRDLTVCVRDRRSLDLARSHFSARSVLCPDMAFGIEGRAEPGAPADYDIVWQARADHESRHLTLPPLDGDVLVTDWAAGQGAAPKWTAQVRAAEQAYQASADDPDGRTSASDRLAALQLRRGCHLLGRGRVVVTDRLHGHLLSLLFGLPHVVLDDRNRKIEGARAAWTGDWAGVRWARTPEDALAHARDLLAGLSTRPVPDQTCR